MTTEGRSAWCRSLLARLVRLTGRTLRGEWHAIVVEPVQRLARRGLSGLLLAFVAAFGVIFFHAIAQHPLGALWVTRLGGVKADLPLWLSLLRTPVSLYVPALDLPVWAGITQLFLAFAWAELALGRVRTLAISYATTLAGTLTARLMIAAGPGWWGFGLPPEAAHVLDTGPSAAVVGLFTYLAVVKRAPVVFTLTGGSMVWESIAVPNLAGREHLIAVCCAIVLGSLHGRRTRLRSRPHILLPVRATAPAQPSAVPVSARPSALPAPVQPSAVPVSAQPSAAPVSAQLPAVRVSAQPPTLPAPARPSEVPVSARPSALPAPAQPSAVPVSAQPSAAPAPARPSAVRVSAQPPTLPAPAGPSAVPAPARPSTVPAPAQPSTVPVSARPSAAPAPVQPSAVPVSAQPPSALPAPAPSRRSVPAPATARRSHDTDRSQGTAMSSAVPAPARPSAVPAPARPSAVPAPAGPSAAPAPVQPSAVPVSAQPPAASAPAPSRRSVPAPATARRSHDTDRSQDTAMTSLEC